MARTFKFYLYHDSIGPAYAIPVSDGGTLKINRIAADGGAWNFDEDDVLYEGPLTSDGYAIFPVPLEVDHDGDNSIRTAWHYASENYYGFGVTGNSQTGIWTDWTTYPDFQLSMFGMTYPVLDTIAGDITIQDLDGVPYEIDGAKVQLVRVSSASGEVIEVLDEALTVDGQCSLEAPLPASQIYDSLPDWANPLSNMELRVSSSKLNVPPSGAGSYSPTVGGQSSLTRSLTVTPLDGHCTLRFRIPELAVEDVNKIETYIYSLPSWNYIARYEIGKDGVVEIRGLREQDVVIEIDQYDGDEIDGWWPEVYSELASDQPASWWDDTDPSIVFTLRPGMNDLGTLDLATRTVLRSSRKGGAAGFLAGQQVRLGTTVYSRGERIPTEVVLGIRRANALISRGVIEPIVEGGERYARNYRISAAERKALEATL